MIFVSRISRSLRLTRSSFRHCFQYPLSPLIPNASRSNRQYLCAMCSVSSSEWKELKVADGMLSLGLTLGTGQAFRWVSYGIEEMAFGNDGKIVRFEEWAGVMNGYLIVMRGEVGRNGRVWWRRMYGGKRVEAKDTEEVEKSVKDYFRADMDMRTVMSNWCKVDARYREVFLKGYSRVRLLRQDPVENLLAFICSSNNNIKRITGMVNSLAKNYGSFVGSYRGNSFYGFPTVEQLVGGVTEAQLRNEGFGYRAKYIDRTSKLLKKLGGREHLLSLRGEDDPENVIRSLLQFDGVGRKVASCVALMSLDVLSAVPVDTHVWKFTKRYYLPKLKLKSLTDVLHRQIGQFFVEKFGANAGIAHNALFVAELSSEGSYAALLWSEEEGSYLKTNGEVTQKARQCCEVTAFQSCSVASKVKRRATYKDSGMKAAFRVKKGVGISKRKDRDRPEMVNNS